MRADRGEGSFVCIARGAGRDQGGSQNAHKLRHAGRPTRDRPAAWPGYASRPAIPRVAIITADSSAKSPIAPASSAMLSMRSTT